MRNLRVPRLSGAVVRAGTLLLLVAILLATAWPPVSAAPTRPAEATEAPVAATPQDTPVVRMVMFWADTCGHCHLVLEQFFPLLSAEYGDRVELRTLEVSIPEHYELWRDTMDRLNVPTDRRAIPMLIIGDRYLVGSYDIPTQLPDLIEQHLSDGGLDHSVAIGSLGEIYDASKYAAPTPVPTVPQYSPGAPPLHLVYLEQAGCNECDRVTLDLNYLKSKYPQIVVHTFGVAEHGAFAEWLGRDAGVPERKRMTAPAVFMAGEALVLDDLTSRSLEDLVARHAETGAYMYWEGWEDQAPDVEAGIIQRFSSFGLLTVIGAGLLDGVNPCAFATMIFLISYLTMRKRAGRELLLTGGAFTAGVFLTYLGVGFGLLRFLSTLPFLNVLGRWIYLATAILCLALALGSFLDYRKAKQGRLDEMTLKLPDRMRGWSKRLIREGSGAKQFVLSAFGLGMGVSVIELACTGQVYLPTIIFVLGVPEWRGQASLALILYNVMFILPLIGVFLLVYMGTTSQQLVDWMQTRTPYIKLGTSMLFLLLAGWLAYSVVRVIT
jgi:cytochrome c biogenesis protein CcdA/glutaredoxin